MPRDSAGNYNLVSGNPVQSGEVISSSWANNTLDDVAVALSDSLDRNGRGGMLAPFRFADGTNLLPGASWTNETTTGLYRFDGGDLRLAVLTQDVMRWQTTGVQIWDNGNSQWNNVLTDGGGGGSQVPVNVGTADGQTLRWEADNSAWEATSALVVDDAGNVTATGDLTAASFIGDGSQLTNLPAGTQWDDVTGGINYAGGNVGIGNSAPTYALEVDGTGTGIKTNGSVLSERTDTFGHLLNKRVGSQTLAGEEAGRITTQAVDETGANRNLSRIRTFAETDITSSTRNGYMTFDIGNGSTITERMRIDAGGNVGIGTTAPARKLHIDGGTDSTVMGLYGDTSVLVDFRANAGAGGRTAYIQSSSNGSLNLANEGGQQFAFLNGGAERMRIDSSGNVKINTGNLELSNGGGWYQSDASWVRSLSDKGVFNASTAATAFATPGDFTAGYSDMRLKTHLGTIPDALDKVCSLEGFYYERNDKAVELGYTGGERRVGLSAQDVQAVLPEVVKDAPINVDNGTDYLTIDYERVVPLLVESIKDLRAEIDELKRNQK